MSSYVYVRSEPGLWTVGFYLPDGHWVAESDHNTSEAAAARVNYLNGAARPANAAPEADSNVRLRQELLKAAWTFEDMRVACQIFGRSLMEESCKIAHDSIIKVLGEAT